MDQEHAANPPELPQHHTAASVKLPGFWCRAPSAWFNTVEANFAIKNIVNETDKFHLTIAALPEDTALKVQRVIAAGPVAGCFTNLKNALVASHQLTPYQKACMLDSLPPLGNRTPSELLVEMMQVCPPGEEHSHLFAFAFLRRLPREVRILLSEDDPANMHAIAEKADRLCSFHVPQHHDTAINAVEDDTIAATTDSKGKSFKKKPSRKYKEDSQPFTSSKLCWYHAKHGANAQSCRSPCNWNSGN